MNDDLEQGRPEPVGRDVPSHDEALRQRLRALPACMPVPPDGWNRLKAALPPREYVGVALPAAPVAMIAPASRRRTRRWAWPVGGALAAGVALYAVLPTAMQSLHPSAVAPTTLQVQASAMTEEYRQAMAALPEQRVADYQPALAELDRSAVQIRDALAQDPRSWHLLEQLQRTYALRLELTRQAAMAATGLTT